ncbi:P22 phage major capsid protein family protein [Anaerosinus sp.]
MGNTLLTPSIIAQESLMVLQNNMVLSDLVYKDYSKEFANVGDTITVRKPATFTVNEFGETIVIQDAKEKGTPVVMDKHLDVSFAITSKDLSLNIVDFSEQFLTPALSAFAQGLDERIAGLYVDVPYCTGTAGTAPNSIGALTGVRKVMNDNKVPMAGRNLVLDTSADAKLLELDSFNRVDASGTSLAMQEAILGRKFGFNCLMDQNIKYHSNGTIEGAAIKLSGPVSKGATLAALTDTSLTGTLKKGSLFTVAGDSTTYVVTEDATAASNVLQVKFYPEMKADVSANTAVTLIADHAANIAFHRNAFALVSRQLSLPMGNTLSSYINYKGMGLRVTFGYDINHKKDICSIDMLCGFKTMIPELACRLLG